jgi:hypothetical protein
MRREDDGRWLSPLAVDALEELEAILREGREAPAVWRS